MNTVKHLVAIPLGGIGAVLICCFLVASVPSETEPPRGQEESADSEICLLVAGGENLQQLEDVEVSAVSPVGIGQLGITGGDGSICVSKDLLRQRQIYAILFCKEGYFCGAYRLDRPLGGRNFLDFDEQFIVLAPFMLG